MENSELSSLRIDSVKITGNDSVMYPFKNFQVIDYNCYIPNGASLLGSKIIITPVFNFFFNNQNDTIKINTQAKLNESWILFKNETTTITAKVTKIDTMSFLGISDSVKTIILNVFDQTMKPTSHILDNTTIIISRQYGLIKTFNFTYFPDYQFRYERGSSFNLTLNGISAPALGTQNLTWLQVHDFQIGDEIHVTTRQTPPLGYIYDNYTYSIDEVQKCIERIDYTDSVFYKFDQFVETNNSAIVTHDTLCRMIKSDSVFDRLANDPIISGNTANYIKQYVGTFDKKALPNAAEDIMSTDNSCWQQIIADGCFPTYFYYKGLGGPYYFCEGFMGDNQKRELVYFKKGNLEWGAPLTLGHSKLPQTKSFRISPNPATNIIQIETDEPIEITLYDNWGRILLQQKVDSKNNSLLLSNLNKGIYICLIQKNGQSIKYEKIIKI
ncbi:MAG: T9SS type A sorting domain-containing protein [Paludibacter sp.]|nr:T9SS type A sorting domain-containing protein [Paludibacter sp.]